MQTKTPYKLLLQSNRQPNSLTHRTQQQIELLSELLINNNIFAYLNLAKNTLRQLCDKLTLIWADNPHAIQINENQVYLILQGKAFQYLHNNSYVLKTRMHNNQEYLMVRKLLHNDFFIVYSPHTKYVNQLDYKKYQLMIDKNTLVGRINGDLYKRYMLPLIEQRSKKIVGFLKKVDMLEHIPQTMLYELSKYMEFVQYEAGCEIINKKQKNPFVFFIVNGEVQYRAFNETNPRESPNKNFYTVNAKTFKKTNLKDNQVFGIDAFHSQTYEQVQMSYSTEAKTKCNLYKIDKRILAIVISSFDNILPKKNKIWSSVNLNDQIQGQGYQTNDMAWLSRNVDKIKTSQKRIRDIKLRFYNTSQRNRKQLPHNEAENDKKDQQLYTIQDIKYQSCQNFAQIKISSAKNKRFYQTLNHKASFNKFQGINEQLKNKMSNIIISPYDQVETQADLSKRQVQSGFQKSNKTLLSKRKSDSVVSTGGKQESDIIRSYLQKKLKNQMLKKAQLILERNKQKLVKQNIKVKRIYSWKSLKNRAVSRQQNVKKQIGDQLYQKMNNVTQNPLFSQIQGQRKKLQVQTTKLKQSQLRVTKRKNSPQKLKKDLIVIQNN